MESPSKVPTRGQSLGGLDGWEDTEDDTLTMLLGMRSGRGVGPRFSGGQATVMVIPSGSGDQQLSDNQQPITTVTRPMNSASIMYTSAFPGIL